MKKPKTIKKVYQKDITLRLTGTNPARLQEVAHSIYALNHPFVVGGRSKRAVQITKISSTEPTSVFYGRIR